MDVQQYRVDQIRQLQQQLEAQAAEYEKKISKHHRGISIINGIVYVLGGVIAVSGIVVSTLLTIPAVPVAAMIAISTSGSVGGIVGVVVKKISTRRRHRYNKYVGKYNRVRESLSRLAAAMSTALDPNSDHGVAISDSEFAEIINKIRPDNESEISLDSPGESPAEDFRLLEKQNPSNI